MDLVPGKPDAKRERVSVKNGCGTKAENGETDKRGRKTEDAGEPLPKRILRSASKKLFLTALPAVVEVEKAKGKAVSTSRKPNTTVTDVKYRRHLDLDPRKPDSKQESAPVKNEFGTKVEDIDTRKRGKSTEEAGEPFPKRILRSASKKFPLTGFSAAGEVKKPKGKAVSTSRKSNTTVTVIKDNPAVKKKATSTETAKPTSSKIKEFSEHKNTKNKGKKPPALPILSAQTVPGTNAILPSKNNTPAEKPEKEFISQEELPKIGDHCSSLDTTTNESMQGRKNPMLLSPIIRCIFGFLDFEDVKSFRFVSREWGSAGKHALTRRALIRFSNDSSGSLPNEFYACFLNSAACFGSFEFHGQHGGPWNIGDLSKFFDNQQKGIKKLAFCFGKFIKDKTIVKNFDISPWISKSPTMVKSDVKYLTKLSIYEVDCAISLSLLKHIKDLSLSHCRIKFEAGVKIHPVKLYLHCIDFYQDETLSTVQINDIVNFSSAKEICLDGSFTGTEPTEFEIDLSGNCRLENLILIYVEVVNWETSKWDIRYMRSNDVEFTATQMTINELYLSPDGGGDFDLFDFPQSIEKLAIGESENVKITCSEPTALENLKYFSVGVNTKADYLFLAHFMNCPQLMHLKFFLDFGRDIPEIRLTCIPKAVKTLTLDRCTIDWLFGSYCYGNIEKIVFCDTEINFERISKAKIIISDVIFICNDSEQEVPKSIVNFFNHPNPWSLCKRFYIGKLKGEEMKLEDSVLNEHVDTKSAFYVFENGEKGRALDEKSFYQLADIPKHIFRKYCD